jgi:N-acetylmuramic acid 6-phosphate etherase
LPSHDASQRWQQDGEEAMDTERALDGCQNAESWPTEPALLAMLDNQSAAFAAVRQAVPTIAAAVTSAAKRLSERGRLIYCGAGSSARIAVQDGVELHPTFGWPPERLAYLIAGGALALVRSVEGAEDNAEAGEREAAALHPCVNDVVVAVAASGTTSYTRAVQCTAHRAGALTIAIANNPGTPLLTESDNPVLLQTGPEFLPGSTRMTAGTAQKIALNLFSTRLMTELGRVYQGFMVDMVPSNAKLVARAHRMVAAITGASLPDAAAAWSKAGGSVKVAVLMLDGLTRRKAEQRLAVSGGHLRLARTPMVS